MQCSHITTGDWLMLIFESLNTKKDLAYFQFENLPDLSETSYMHWIHAVNHWVHQQPTTLPGFSLGYRYEDAEMKYSEP